MASKGPSGNYGGGGGGKENGGGARDNGQVGVNGKDNVFDLDSAAFASDEFRMHEFKVKRCPRARPHDWTQCPFAHPGEKARRRDPRRYKYSGTACPEFRKSGCCRRGDACPFAHGVFECWLHPSRYRTQLCTDGINCKRRVCFFAHVEEELRHPDDDPGVAQRQVQAELAAEVQTLQQQHLTQALQALLMQTTTNPLAMPERHPIQYPAAMPEMLKPSSEMPTAGLISDASVDNSNPTAALQLVLLQQLAAKEQQFQQTVGDKSGGDISVVSSVPETTLTPSSGNIPLQQPDVYDTLSQLKQLSLAATSPVSSATPAVAPSFDATALLSQIMPNGQNVSAPDLQAQHPVLLNTLLNQNAAKDAAPQSNGHTRRSIDNSYLSSLLNDGSNGHPFGSIGFPATAYVNGFGAHGTNGITAATTTVAMPPPPQQQQQLIVPNGVHPSVSGPAPTPYSVENIQRLLQNPAFSSNLSQLLQMNPALLQQLAPTPTPDTGNASRHSIDNAYLTRLNTDMNRFVNNGGMHSVASGGHTTQQTETLMVNGLTTTAPPTNGDEKMFNGAIASEALLQELNALKLQLGNTPSNPMNMTGGVHESLNFPPHSSSVDSEVLTSSGPSSSTQQQGQSEDL